MSKKFTIAFLTLATALSLTLPALARPGAARHGIASHYGRLYNYAPVHGFWSPYPSATGGGSLGYSANMRFDQW